MIENSKREERSEERSEGRRGAGRVSILEFLFSVGVGVCIFAASPFTFASAGLGAVVGILFWGTISLSRSVFESADRKIKAKSERGDGPGLDRWLRIYTRTWGFTTVLFVPVTLLYYYISVVSEMARDEGGFLAWEGVGFLLLYGPPIAPFLAVFVSFPTACAIYWLRRRKARKASRP